jgi:sugar O-acyltransferase (sialic acid O-acetyltransferase NeuD family)
MINLVILGAGGFGREVLCWAEDVVRTRTDLRISGFLDDNQKIFQGKPEMPPIIGGFRDYTLKPNDQLVCAVGDPKVKAEIYAHWKMKGATFFTLIHPTVVVGRRVNIGEGCVVCPYVVLTSDVTLGSIVTLNIHCTVGHDAQIGTASTLSAHSDVTGYAYLADGVFLGSHAVITPKIQVGRYSKIGAGSMVVANVKPGATMLGVPARQIAGFE